MKESRVSPTVSLAAFLLSLLPVFLLALSLSFVIRAVSPPAARQIPCTYRVRISHIDRRLIVGIAAGDTVLDAVTKTPLGRVTAVQVTPALHEAVQNGRRVALPLAGSCDITLSLEASLDVSHTTSGGIAIRAGKTLYLRLPRYTGAAICLGLSEEPADPAERSPSL